MAVVIPSLYCEPESRRRNPRTASSGEDDFASLLVHFANFASLRENLLFARVRPAWSAESIPRKDPRAMAGLCWPWLPCRCCEETEKLLSALLSSADASNAICQRVAFSKMAYSQWREKGSRQRVVVLDVLTNNRQGLGCHPAKVVVSRSPLHARIGAFAVVPATNIPPSSTHTYRWAVVKVDTHET